MRSIVLVSAIASLFTLTACGNGAQHSAVKVADEPTAPAEESTADRFFREVALDGETALADLNEDARYAMVDGGIVVKVSPIPSDSVSRHYRVTNVTSDTGFVFTMYASYLDEEDGGNTYGWVEDAQGVAIAEIQDGYFVSATSGDDDDGTWFDSLPDMPRTLAAPLATTDEAAIHALVVTLVEEYEHRPVNPDGDEETQLEVYEGDDCTVSATQIICETNYNQDRWNGTIRTTLKLENGAAVAIEKAQFTGSF